MIVQENKNLEWILSLKDRISQKIGKERLPIIMMIVTNLIWPCNFYYVSQHNISVWESTLARGVSIVISHLIIFKIFGISSDLKTCFDLKYMLIRNSIVIVHQLIYSQMHYYIPYPINNSLTLTGPLFVFVVDYLVNKNTINRAQIFGIIIGIIGVLFASNSQYIFVMIDEEYAPKSTFNHYKTQSIPLKMLMVLISLISNILWAYAIVVQKNIKHIPGIKISFCQGVQMIFTCSIAFLLGIAKPSGLFFEACLFSGLGLGLCQIFFMSALNMSKDTGILTILMFLYIIPAYLISMFRYDQPLNPVCLGGILLMLYGLYQAIFKKDK